MVEHQLVAKSVIHKSRCTGDYRYKVCTTDGMDIMCSGLYSPIICSLRVPQCHALTMQLHLHDRAGTLASYK